MVRAEATQVAVLDEDERFSALSAISEVVDRSSSVEHTLRSVLCALVASKYAVVLVGRQNHGNPVDDCIAVLDVHREISDENKASLRAALAACKKAGADRNLLVHGYKFTDMKTGDRASPGRGPGAWLRWPDDRCHARLGADA